MKITPDIKITCGLPKTIRVEASLTPEALLVLRILLGHTTDERDGLYPLFDAVVDACLALDLDCPSGCRPLSQRGYEKTVEKVVELVRRRREEA